MTRARDLRRRVAALEARQRSGPGIWGTIVVTDDGELVGLTTFLPGHDGLDDLRAWAKRPHEGLVFLWVWPLTDVPTREIIPASEISSEALRRIEGYRTPGAAYHQT